MAHHKREAFGIEENELADFAKALGHPARIAILKELATRKSCVCGEIVSVLPLAQATVSQHLKELPGSRAHPGYGGRGQILLLHQLGGFPALPVHFRHFLRGNRATTLLLTFITPTILIMESTSNIKDLVRDQYGKIANQSPETGAASCCGVGPPGSCSIMADNYSSLKGYNPEADLGLGCGLPTEFAHIQEGDVVLDLGSGAGNDAFVARAETGATGKVIGVDFTPAMIEWARRNAEKLGYHNIEFRQGDIENLPVTDNSVDVIVSNCVLNLVPDKGQVFTEILRTLRPGGHFSISDVVLVGALPEAVVQSAELYAGCVSGAVQLEEYLAIIRETGFQNITIQKQKPILLPDELLFPYLSADEIRTFIEAGTGIYSVTVYAEKAGGNPAERATVKATAKRAVLAETCGCNPASGCC